MRTNRWKQVLTLVLVLALLAGLGTVPVGALEAEIAGPAFSQAIEAQKKTVALAEEKETSQQAQLYDDDEIVTFLITLKESGIAGSVPKGMGVKDYMQTAAGVNTEKLVEQAQKQVAAYFSRISRDIKVEKTYSVLLNGFAIKAPYRVLRSLQQIPGVETVTVSQTYALPQEEPVEPENGDSQLQMTYSGEMLQSVEAAAAGYSGQGMVIAVVDTSLDVAHPDFAAAPEETGMDREDVAAVIAENTLNAAITDPSAVYISQKIPFAYDYAQKDTDVGDDHYHGTHVSGSAVGNSDSHKGVAPDAQLVFMKVFDGTSADEMDVITALEDCALLGVDVINLSLGSGGGFTYVDTYQSALDTCRQLGIQVVAACGNDTDARYGLNNVPDSLGLTSALVSEPDIGYTASPSTGMYALSVASAVRIYSELRVYLLCAEQKIYYSDMNPGSQILFEQVLSGDYEYVMVPGFGAAQDYEGLDVAGKLAVVHRGEITFVDKEQNAYDAGAAGLIVVNSEEDVPSVNLEQLLPAVFVSTADGEILQQQENKVLTVSADQAEYVEADRGGLMANSSSLGVAPDMTLKPEITAPGYGEYSAVPGGGYETYNGTSMASPQIAGASALLTQYYRQQYPEMSSVELAQRVSTVLMNTAKLVTDEQGVPYTPRKQGSGLAQIMDAMQAEGYVTVDENHRPVAQLGSKEDGSFQTSLTIHNTDDAAQTYDLKSVDLVPGTETINGYLCMSLACRELTEEELTVRFSQDTVTVPAGGSVTVDVTLELTEAGKAGLADFCNGIYVEGYLICDSAEGVDLHVPYIGFFGDWYALDIFDDSAYGEEIPSVYGSRVACIDATGNGIYLGTNAYDTALPLSMDNISVGHQYMNQGYLPSFWYGMLRGAKTVTFEVLDATGQAVELYHPETGEAMGTSLVSNWQPKTAFSASSGTVLFNYYPDVLRWYPVVQTEQGLSYLPDGVYTVRVTAMPDGTDDASYAQSFDMPVRLDSQMPEVTSFEVLAVGQKRYLRANLQDNHMLMGAQLANVEENSAYNGMVAASGETAEYLVDVTELVNGGITAVKLYLCDYARNYAFSEAISLDVTRVLPEQVNLVEDTFTCEGAQTVRLEAWVEPETVTDAVLTWTSDDENVATVTALDVVRQDRETGRIYYQADVSVKNVTAQTTVRVSAESGCSAQAVFTVTAIDTAALEELIRQAESLRAEEYTAQSWENLQAAVKIAKEALAAQPLSREQLIAAQQLLQEALDNLQKAEAPEETTQPTQPEETTEPAQPEESTAPTTAPTEPQEPSDQPDTGDKSQLGLYAAISVLSLTAAVCMILLAVQKPYKPKYTKRNKSK